MALTVKHLNADASFLLSFEPLPTSTHPGGPIPEPFRVILDPWISGPSKIFHPRIAISTHKEAACISNLRELPEPDVVIISQHKTDHCNEATLRQLPASGTKTIILAEPAAARIIRGWKYFDPAKVLTIPRWEDPRLTGRDTIIRVPVPPATPGGKSGELTVAFIPQRRDISGLHAAVGITYRAPPAPDQPRQILNSPQWEAPGSMSDWQPTTVRADDTTTPKASATQFGNATGTVTPPDTPRSQRSAVDLRTGIESNHTEGIITIMDATKLPTSMSLRSCHSALSLPLLPTPPPRSPLRPSSSSSATITASSDTAPSEASATTASSFTTAPSTTDSSMDDARAPVSTTPAITPTPVTRPSRPLSVIFSPHGISYASLNAYVTSHLISETALPLTCLLHCFDAVSNPWWLGGNVLLGAPAGQETAMRLGAKAWISAHDGDKEVRGLATKLLRTVKWDREVLQCLSASEFVIRKGVGAGAASGARGGYKGTEVLALGSGQDVMLSSEGVWKDEAQSETKPPERQAKDSSTTGSQPAQQVSVTVS